MFTSICVHYQRGSGCQASNRRFHRLFCPITSTHALPQVGAILHLGQPSVTVLGARSLLYGARSPAGRLVQTIYPEAYQDQISIFDFGMRPSAPGGSPFARPDCTNHDPTKCPK